MRLLKENNVAFRFHDFSKDGLSREKIIEWLSMHPLQKVLNKKSTAWRILSPEEQQTAETETGAVNLIMQYSNLIKRPVAEISGTTLIGFDDKEYRTALNL